MVGPYEGFARNAEAHARVMRHAATGFGAQRFVLDRDVLRRWRKAWADVIKIGGKNGWRNAQASVLAPTGTIGFMMDCDTTGIEPDFSLVKFASWSAVARCRSSIRRSRRRCRSWGTHKETVEGDVEHIAEHGHVIDAPGLKPEHYDVLIGARWVSVQITCWHVRMMSAVQPFLPEPSRRP